MMPKLTSKRDGIRVEPIQDKIFEEAESSLLNSNDNNCLNKSNLNYNDNQRSDCTPVLTPRGSTSCRQNYDFIPTSTLIQRLFHTNKPADMNDTAYCRKTRQLIFYLHRMWLNQAMCDVIINAIGGSVMTHQVVLGAYSPTLSIIFSQMQIQKTATINMLQIPREVVADVLNFLYTTDLRLNCRVIEHVVLCAKQLDLPIILDVCSDYLVQAADAENLILHYSVAANNELIEVKEQLLTVIAKSFDEIHTHPHFFLLPTDRFLDILTNENICCTNLLLMEAIVQWIDFDRLKRVDYAKDLLTCVNFEKIDPAYLTAFLDRYDWLVANETCRDLVFDIYKYHALATVRERNNTSKSDKGMFDFSGENCESPEKLNVLETTLGNLRRTLKCAKPTENTCIINFKDKVNDSNAIKNFGFKSTFRSCHNDRHENSAPNSMRYPFPDRTNCSTRSSNICYDNLKTLAVGNCENSLPTVRNDYCDGLKGCITNFNVWPICGKNVCFGEKNKICSNLDELQMQSQMTSDDEFYCSSNRPIIKGGSERTYSICDPCKTASILCHKPRGNFDECLHKFRSDDFKVNDSPAEDMLKKSTHHVSYEHLKSFKNLSDRLSSDKIDSYKYISTHTATNEVSDKRPTKTENIERTPSQNLDKKLSSFDYEKFLQRQNLQKDDKFFSSSSESNKFLRINLDDDTCKNSGYKNEEVRKDSLEKLANGTPIKMNSHIETKYERDKSQNLEKFENMLAQKSAEKISSDENKQRSNYDLRESHQNKDQLTKVPTRNDVQICFSDKSTSPIRQIESEIQSKTNSDILKLPPLDSSDTPVLRQSDLSANQSKVSVFQPICQPKKVLIDRSTSYKEIPKSESRSNIEISSNLQSCQNCDYPAKSDHGQMENSKYMVVPELNNKLHEQSTPVHSIKSQITGPTTSAKDYYSLNRQSKSASDSPTIQEKVITWENLHRNVDQRTSVTNPTSVKNFQQQTISTSSLNSDSSYELKPSKMSDRTNTTQIIIPKSKTVNNSRSITVLDDKNNYNYKCEDNKCIPYDPSLEKKLSENTKLRVSGVLKDPATWKYEDDRVEAYTEFKKKEQRNSRQNSK